MLLLLESQTLKLVDPQDQALLHAQPVASIRVWGVGRDSGRWGARGRGAAGWGCGGGSMPMGQGCCVGPHGGSAGSRGGRVGSAVWSGGVRALHRVCAHGCGHRAGPCACGSWGRGCPVPAGCARVRACAGCGAGVPCVWGVHMQGGHGATGVPCVGVCGAPGAGGAWHQGGPTRVGPCRIQAHTGLGACARGAQERAGFRVLTGCGAVGGSQGSGMALCGRGGGHGGAARAPALLTLLSGSLLLRWLGTQGEVRQPSPAPVLPVPSLAGLVVQAPRTGRWGARAAGVAGGGCPEPQPFPAGTLPTWPGTS